MHNLNNVIAKQGIQRLITIDLALWIMTICSVVDTLTTLIEFK